MSYLPIERESPMNHAQRAILLALLAAGATGAIGQLPSLPGMGSVGGLGGLPDISGVGMGNAAGVLGYCTKNKLLGGSSDASSVLSTLGKKPGVTTSKEFTAGQAGQIVGEKGAKFSLDSVTGPMKSKACNMVLKQARNFL
jgi:hypothetical protein